MKPFNLLLLIGLLGGCEQNTRVVDCEHSEARSPQYTHHQIVIICSGFYRGNAAKLLNVRVLDRTISYEAQLSIAEETIYIQLQEGDICTL